MSEIYSDKHRALQETYDTVRLADRIEEIIVRPEVSSDHKAFIESRDMFFLTSVDHRGYPTCSYKGGAPRLRAGGGQQDNRFSELQR